MNSKDIMSSNTKKNDWNDLFETHKNLFTLISQLLMYIIYIISISRLNDS